jgi:hypothetical protein
MNDNLKPCYVVIPDAERLDIGKNKPIAIFKEKKHAESWAKYMYESFFIIEEVDTNYFND